MKNNARVNLKINEPEGGRVEIPHTEREERVVEAQSAPTMSASEASKSVDAALDDLKGI
jgi:hypothetical protein